MCRVGLEREWERGGWGIEGGGTASSWTNCRLCQLACPTHSLSSRRWRVWTRCLPACSRHVPRAWLPRLPCCSPSAVTRILPAPRLPCCSPLQEAKLKEKKSQAWQDRLKKQAAEQQAKQQK